MKTILLMSSLLVCALGQSQIAKPENLRLVFIPLNPIESNYEAEEDPLGEVTELLEHRVLFEVNHLFNVVKIYITIGTEADPDGYFSGYVNVLSDENVLDYSIADGVCTVNCGELMLEDEYYCEVYFEYTDGTTSAAEIFPKPLLD